MKDLLKIMQELSKDGVSVINTERSGNEICITTQKKTIYCRCAKCENLVKKGQLIKIKYDEEHMNKYHYEECYAENEYCKECVDKIYKKHEIKA